MEVSKLTIDKRWLHQQSKQTDMLLWMQNHPNKLHDTTITNIVHTMALDKDFELGLTEGSANQVFYALMRRGLVARNRERGRADFYINYYHPDLPPIVREKQPYINMQTMGTGVIHVPEVKKPKMKKIKMEKEPVVAKKPVAVKDTAPQFEEKPKAEIVIKYGKVEVIVSDKVELGYLVRLVKELNKE